MENINCGVYKIINLINGKIYIGSSIHLKHRFDEHIQLLKRNTHRNKHLQAAFNKYGQENFQFEVIEYINDENILLDREQYWMDKLNVCDDKVGYNIAASSSAPMLGKNHTQEAKLKMSEANSKKKYSEETIEKRRIKILGEKHPNTKFTKQDIIKIKTMLYQGCTDRYIATIFQVHKSTISSIKRGKTWASVVLDNVSNEELKVTKSKRYRLYGDIATNVKLDSESVLQIKKLLAEGKKNIEIAKMFNVNKATVSDIKTGRTWKHVEFSLAV